MKEDTGKHMGHGEHLSEMLTVREVAGLLHAHPNNLRRWSKYGTIRAYRITSWGDRRFRRKEIAHFLAKPNGHSHGGQEAERRQFSQWSIGPLLQPPGGHGKERDPSIVAVITDTRLSSWSHTGDSRMQPH